MTGGGSIMTQKGPNPTLPVPVGRAEVDKIYSLEDVDPIGRIEVLIYGPPGGCKTSLAATFPPPFRWIDADNGLKTLRWAYAVGKTSLHCLGPHCIQAYRPLEDERYPRNPKALDQTADMIAHWFTPAEVDKWQTLVLDSATEINLWCVYKGLHLNGLLPKRERPLSNSDEINEKAMTLLLTGEQDWKSAQGLFMSLLTDVRVDCAKFNKNLVVICHEWTDSTEDRDGNVRVSRYMPFLIGQLRARVPKDFDDVWYTQLFNGQDPKVQMHGSADKVTKTRWGQVPNIQDDFDFRRMLEKVKKFHNIK
jgi:hypothetical protein